MAVRQPKVHSAACSLRANQRDTLGACVCLENSHSRHKSEVVIHKATVIIILPTVHGAMLPCELRPICDILAIRQRCNHATALVDTRVGSACVGQLSNQTHRTYGRRGEGSVHFRPITEDGSDHLQLLRQGAGNRLLFSSLCLAPTRCNAPSEHSMALAIGLFRTVSMKAGPTQNTRLLSVTQT
ncbi:exo-alpha-sialidase [Trypanosoma cruzi]|nr:exo-alpha-sialidase [Trypanosoma cruzi]